MGKRKSNFAIRPVHRLSPIAIRVPTRANTGELTNGAPEIRHFDKNVTSLSSVLAGRLNARMRESCGLVGGRRSTVTLVTPGLAGALLEVLNLGQTDFRSSADGCEMDI